jgi:hypothetical protein
VLDVRGNDAARQLVPRPESVFSQVRESQTPAFTPRLRSTITYSVTPPRQNSMESDRPTHIITDTQNQRQCCTRISPTAAYAEFMFETASFGTLHPTWNWCLQTASRLCCNHDVLRLNLSRGRRLTVDTFYQSLSWAFSCEGYVGGSCISTNVLKLPSLAASPNSVGENVSASNRSLVERASRQL